MAIVLTFACSVCQRQRETANHWRLCWIHDGRFISQSWNDELAAFDTVHHVCGVEHAMVLYSRFLSTGNLQREES